MGLGESGDFARAKSPLSYMIIQHLVSLTLQPSQSESGLLCSSAGVEAVPEVSPAGVEVRQLDADKEILAVSV